MVSTNWTILSSFTKD